MKTELNGILLAASLAASSAAFAADQTTQSQTPAEVPPQTRCDALKQKLLSDAYDWRVYAQIGDALMELAKPREAAAAYEKAIAIYPLSKERNSEMRQADFIAAQASADAERQRIAADAARRQAEAAEMASTMETLSMLPGAGSTRALAAQQGMAAAATMTQGKAQADAANAQAKQAEIANPMQSVNFTLPERQETAGLWIKLGRAYAACGENDRAGSAFEQGMSIDPARMDALYQAGVALCESGQRAKAALAASRYLALSPGDPPPAVCILLGDALRGQGMEREAVKAYEAAAKSLAKNAAAKNNDFSSLLSLGGARIKAGDYAGALDAFKKAAASNPASPAPFCGMIVCEISLRDKSGLADAAAKLGAAPSLNANENYALGRAFDALNNETEAARRYALCAAAWEAAGKAQDELPGSALFAKAIAGGDAAQGIALLKAKIARDPFSSDAFLDFHRLGLAYLKLKEPRPDLAADAFRQALIENPSFAQAGLELATLCEKNAADVETLIAKSDAAQDKKLAAALRAKAWALAPDGAKRDKLLLEIAALANEAGQPPPPDEAIADWLKANAALNAKRGISDIKRAALEFSRARTLAPWDQSLLLNLAICHSAMGRNDLALTEIDQLMKTPAGRTRENLAKKFEFENLQTIALKEGRDLTPFK